MHVLGKVFLGLTIVLAVFDAYLATLLLGHRAHWQQQIEKAQTDYAQTHETLVATRDKVRGLELAVNRIQDTWGQYWSVPQGRPLNAQVGSFAIGGGAALGIPQPPASGPAPIVYLFSEEADGSSRFLGGFRMTEVQADQASGQIPHQPPMPPEIAGLQQYGGTPIRVRETVPSAWRSALGDFYAQYAVAEQNLTFQANQLRIQNEQLVKSQAILDQRLAELNGDPQPPEGASQEVIDGLVLTIRKEENARNAALQVLDGLRHDYARKTNELNNMVAGNKSRVAELPGYEQSLEKPPVRDREGLQTTSRERSPQ
jgi:cell division protein FtsB